MNTTGRQASTVPKSNHQIPSGNLRRRLGNTLAALALATTLLVLTTTTAGAMPNRAGYGLPGETQTTLRVIAPTSGFSWPDAGIGAAAGLAISVIAIGIALAINHRHDRGVRTTISATR